MASIYKRGDKWAYIIDVGIHPETGKRKQKTKSGFKTKKEAAQAAADMERSFSFAGDKSLTFEELYNEWWEGHKLTIKPTTAKTFKSHYNNHILPYFAKYKIKDITRKHCQKFINALHENRPGSVLEIKTKANQVFRYAMQEDLIVKNPMQHVVIPKKDEEELLDGFDQRNYWEKEEVKLFLSKVVEEYPSNEANLFRMLIYVGLRKGEALALTWDDIDFNEGTARITKTIYFANGESHVQTAKTASGRRTVDIDDGTLKQLKRHRALQREHYFEMRPEHNNNILFARPDGRHMRLAQVNELLKSVINKLDIHPITVHGLRHTYASLAFEAGADIEYVKSQLGHKNIQTTSNIYTHVTKSKKEKTSKLFADFMES